MIAAGFFQMLTPYAVMITARWRSSSHAIPEIHDNKLMARPMLDALYSIYQSPLT